MRGAPKSDIKSLKKPNPFGPENDLCEITDLLARQYIKAFVNAEIFEAVRHQILEHPSHHINCTAINISFSTDYLCI